MVADAWTALQAASLARDDAAIAHERGEDIALRTTTAKRLAIVGGGAGRQRRPTASSAGTASTSTPRTPTSLNDIKVLKVAGGSTEIMRNYIAQRILKDPGHEGLAMTQPRRARSSTRRRARPELRLGTVDDQVDARRCGRTRRRPGSRALDDGLRQVERVALVAPTSTDYIVTWLACLLAGTPVALVNPTYPDELVGTMLAPLGPDLVLRRRRHRAMRPHARGEHDAEVTLPGLHADRFAVASFMHTSGTTGLPKFCAQTHDYFRRMAAAMAGRTRPHARRPRARAACRCSTSTRWATASSPRCSPAPTR